MIPVEEMNTQGVQDFCGKYPQLQFNASRILSYKNHGCPGFYATDRSVAGSNEISALEFGVNCRRGSSSVSNNNVVPIMLTTKIFITYM